MAKYHISHLPVLDDVVVPESPAVDEGALPADGQPQTHRVAQCEAMALAAGLRHASRVHISAALRRFIARATLPITEADRQALLMDALRLEDDDLAVFALRNACPHALVITGDDPVLRMLQALARLTPAPGGLRGLHLRDCDITGAADSLRALIDRAGGVHGFGLSGVLLSVDEVMTIDAMLRQGLRLTQLHLGDTDVRDRRWVTATDDERARLWGGLLGRSRGLLEVHLDLRRYTATACATMLAGLGAHADSLLRLTVQGGHFTAPAEARRLALFSHLQELSLRGCTFEMAGLTALGVVLGAHPALNTLMLCDVAVPPGAATHAFFDQLAQMPALRALSWTSTGVPPAAVASPAPQATPDAGGPSEAPAAQAETATPQATPQAASSAARACVLESSALAALCVALARHPRLRELDFSGTACRSHDLASLVALVRLSRSVRRVVLGRLPLGPVPVHALALAVAAGQVSDVVIDWPANSSQGMLDARQHLATALRHNRLRQVGQGLVPDADARPVPQDAANESHGLPLATQGAVRQWLQASLHPEWLLSLDLMAGMEDAGTGLRAVYPQSANPLQNTSETAQAQARVQA